ncbi:hypothetical protein LCGC14_1354520 [marine sediment metagenome]|uniref:Phage head-tail adaptor n=1 Tax=marine sediment metagenome TaxID=412755 RepID=A0A0F9MQH6_9ZZZZ
MGISTRFLNRDVEVKRLTYSGTPKKGVFGVVATFKGYLRPLTEVQASANGFQFGQGFSLLADESADIKESDEITIEGKKYKVQGVANHDRGGLQHKRAILSLPEKQ